MRRPHGHIAIFESRYWSFQCESVRLAHRVVRHVSPWMSGDAGPNSQPCQRRTAMPRVGSQIDGPGDKTKPDTRGCSSNGYWEGGNAAAARSPTQAARMRKVGLLLVRQGWRSLTWLRNTAGYRIQKISPKKCTLEARSDYRGASFKIDNKAPCRHRQTASARCADAPLAAPNAEISPLRFVARHSRAPARSTPIGKSRRGNNGIPAALRVQAPGWSAIGRRCRCFGLEIAAT